ISQYLFKKIRNLMNEEILKLSGREKLKEQGELVSEHICPKCNQATKTKQIGKYICPDIRCKTEVESMVSNRKDMICPSCNGKMKRISQREIQYCELCKINTAKLEATSSFGGIQQQNTRQKFKEEVTIKSTEDSVDIVLVSPRHLFRAPYSLHEKTAFASIVLDKDKIETFKPTDADPLKITTPKSFMPNSEEGEAKQLLIRAIEEAHENKPEEKTKKYEGESINLKGLMITEKMYPPIIKKLLLGIKDDGRKRALSLILSFFVSLEFPQDFIEEKIETWNKKNYQPLKQGYIKSQILWYAKNKRLPPNYDKPIYKEFGIHSPPEPGMKNPINYTIKKALQSGKKPRRKFPSNENKNIKEI
ncbi:MAG: hypothetical protein U9Q73_00030, partial [Nanoarchaeota archaeon]|nr:hypothetical protein [Nanoarchaeota archaeon]